VNGNPVEIQSRTNAAHPDPSADAGHFPLKPWQAYGLAVVATAATLGVRLALDAPLGGQPTLVMFTLPIMISAYAGGLRGGLLATALSYLGASYYLLAPIHSLRIASGVEHWHIFFVALSGVVISALNEALHRARRRADIVTGERLHLARQLETDSARLVAAQAVAKVGSWETDLSTFAVIWSNETHRIFETSPDTFQPTHAAFLEFIHPDDRVAVDGAFVRSIGQPGAQAIEHRLLMPDGRIKFVEERWQTYSDGQGRGLRATGTCQDITDRKLSENALRESNQNFRHLTDNITDAFWIRSADMRKVHYISPAFERIWGRTVASLYANPHGWVDFILPEDREWVVDAFARLTADGAEVDIEYRIVRPSGEVRWIRARGFQVRDAANSLIRHTGIVTDVTERRHTEMQVREQAALLDIAHEAIQVRDLDGRIIYWNKGAEHIYGWTAAEVLGRTAVEMFYKEAARFREALAELVAQGKWQGEVITQTKDGRNITVEGRWTLVRDADGRPKSVLAIDTDITEKKRLESQFLRAQRMESIGTLAGGIAHDLNNVLAPILMSVKLLDELVRDDDDRALLATLHSSAQRGADLVKQVLSFARGVEGERILVNPLHLMRDLLKVMGDTFPKSIDVRFSPAPDLWTVTGDPTQMHQVFLNLCINARDAMPEGGQLTVSMTNVLLDELDVRGNREGRPGAFVMLTVQDTGIGISPETRDKIFEPFFTTKEIGKGTGLGLSTALAIVKSHQGFIQLDSKPGAGTTFNIYLPANPHEAATKPVAVEPARLAHGHGELILVVDDEAGIRALSKRTLERYGYRALLACQGAEALSLYVQHRDDIAVVLTDMTMPIMDGPALIIALKAMNPRVRVIASSGLTSSGGVDRAVGEAVEHFLPKPYTADALLTILREVLIDDGHRAPVSV
jgi:PAS domain S-box-containing protein